MKAFRNMLRRGTAGFTLIEIMIVVLIIGILLAIAIPNFIQARDSSRAKACVANLQEIDAAKQQYIMDNKVSTFTNETPTGPSDTCPIIGQNLYIRVAPSCPSGGVYSTQDFSTPPTCSYGSTDGTQFNHAIA